MDNILVQHRVNTINDLKSIPTHFGIEVDIREQNGDLICAHDPVSKGELFKDFLFQFNHKFIIANIKEEGIEKDVIACIEENKIENYFLLDVTFPYLVKLFKEGINKIALRVSDFEQFDEDIVNKFNIEWIWLDAFEQFPIKELKKIKFCSKYFNLKVCLVSPELHMSRSKLDSTRILDQIKASNYSFDAICTKNLTEWQS